MLKHAFLFGALVTTAAPSLGQTHDHQAMAQAPRSEPREPGQAAYAALGEVVRILIEDPATDWSKVDVGALRNHLVDMDNVTMRAAVQTTRLPNGARFQVSGDPTLAASIQRMTKAHFAQPEFDKAWTMRATPTANGADIVVTSADRADAAQINALGFFGILAMGDHHQPHHLMMARGGMRH